MSTVPTPANVAQNASPPTRNPTRSCAAPGGILTTATVRDATHWDDLVKGLDLGDLTRHGLRHTGATWMADAGIPLHVLQGILGHQHIETTKGYLHSDHRHLAAAARQADQFLSAPSPRREPPHRDVPHL